MKEDDVLPFVLDSIRYAEAHAQHFTGRRWVFEAINDWLGAAGRSRYFLLTGEPGSGKTAIASRLCRFSLGRADPHNGAALLKPGFLKAAHFCSAQRPTSLSPLAFVRSVASQLSIDNLEYARALAAAAEKPKVINIGQLNIKQQADVADRAYMIGLVMLLDLSRSSPRDAFTRAVVEPLQSIYRGGYEGPTVILVDALDESFVPGEDTPVARLLTPLKDLPPQVRFILTSRHVSDVLGMFLDPDGSYDGINLSKPEFDSLNNEDIERYVRQRFEQEGALAEKAGSLAADEFLKLVALITEKAAGNFLYVSFLLEEMRDGKRPLHDVKTLPDRLDGLYAESLDRAVHLGGGRWPSHYSRLTGVLSVAQENLTLDQLRAFTGCAEGEAWDALRAVEQFVEGARGETGETAYRLYHQSVIDFFRRRELSGGHGPVLNKFYLPPRDYHALVVAYYRAGAKTWKAPSAERFDGYGTRHLLTHLELAGRLDGLHELLALETAEWKNAWFAAKEAHADVASFVADVGRAWRLASDSYDPKRKSATGINVGRQSRYALITASVASLARIIRPESLERDVKDGRLTARRGVAYARQIPDHGVRHQAMVNLSDSEGLTERERKAILREVLSAPSSTYGYEPNPATTLAAAARLAGMGEHNEAVRAVSGIADEDERALRLVELAPHLPPDRAKAVLDEVLSMHSEAYLRTLRRVAPRFAELGHPDMALELLREIQRGVPTREELDSQHKQREFIEEELANEPLPLNEVRKRWYLEDEARYAREDATNAIMSGLLAGRYFEQARAALGALTREYDRQKWSERLNAAADSSVGGAAAPEFAAPAEAAAGEVGDPQAAPPDEDLRAAGVIGDEEEVSRLLVRLEGALRLGKPRTEAALPRELKRIEKTDCEDEKEAALAEIIPHLPRGLLPSAFEIAKALPQSDAKPGILADIATRIPGKGGRDALKHALKAAVGTHGCVVYRAGGLLKFFGILPALKPWLPLLADIHRVAPLNLMWPRLSRQVVEEALREVRRDGTDEDAVGRLDLLAKYLGKPDKEKLLKEALEAAVEYDGIRSREHDEAPAGSDSGEESDARDIRLTPLGRLFSRFLPSQWNKALAEAGSGPDAGEGVSGLLELCPYAPARLKKKVIEKSLELLKASLATFYYIKRTAVWYPPVPQDMYVPELENEFAGEWDDTAFDVIWMIDELVEADASEEVSDILGSHEALQVALAIDSAHLRAEALNLLLPLVPEDVQESALSAAEQMGEYGLPETLDVLARHLPPGYHATILKMARDMEEAEYKAEALTLIASHLEDDEDKSQVLSDALELSVTLHDARQRAEQARHLVPLLTRLPLPLLARLWGGALPVLAARGREDLLHDLRAFWPVVKVLGGVKALSETLKAVKDASRWWP